MRRDYDRLADMLEEQDLDHLIGGLPDPDEPGSVLAGVVTELAEAALDDSPSDTDVENWRHDALHAPDTQALGDLGCFDDAVIEDLEVWK